MSLTKTQRTRRTTTSRIRGGASHICVACGAPTRVRATRRLDNGGVKRIRECQKCSTRFETIECTNV